jgi:hypothetical protein
MLFASILIDPERNAAETRGLYLNLLTPQHSFVNLHIGT